jgi:hypothetical protein
LAYLIFWTVTIGYYEVIGTDVNCGNYGSNNLLSGVSYAKAEGATGLGEGRRRMGSMNDRRCYSSALATAVVAKSEKVKSYAEGVGGECGDGEEASTLPDSMI